jgi:hypothetical protein
MRWTDALARWYAPTSRRRGAGFCTGYMANLAVVTALGDEHTEIFSEQLNHASLIDGARLAKARCSAMAHADVAGLARVAGGQHARKVKLIVTDAVFSMDGDLAPLPELLALAEEHDAWLIVDDAHGFGVLGEQGRGAWSISACAANASSWSARWARPPACRAPLSPRTPPSRIPAAVGAQLHLHDRLAAGHRACAADQPGMLIEGDEGAAPPRLRACGRSCATADGAARQYPRLGWR